MHKHNNSLIKRMSYGLKRTGGTPVHIDLRNQRQFAGLVRAVPVSHLSDNELKELVSQKPEDEEARTLADKFAALGEIIERQIGFHAFDEQLIAGRLMLGPRAVQMQTGEGKTLAAVFTAVIHGVSGRRCWIMTANDYLAGRDCREMGPVYRALGLTCASVSDDMTGAEKQMAYAADICYVTAKQAGFDYLRDCIATDLKQLVLPEFDICLVDEADHIMIDEARLPLVIAGERNDPDIDYRRYLRIARSLRKDVDYSCHPRKLMCPLTLEGRRQFFELIGLEEESETAPDAAAAVQTALLADQLIHRDIDYIVIDSQIRLVDGFTGRGLSNREWPDGIQRFLEAKEGLAPKAEGKILSSISIESFLSLFPAVSAMSATIESSAGELNVRYGLETWIIPPRLPLIREDRPDMLFAGIVEKRRKMLALVREARKKDAAVLVATASVKESESVSAMLEQAGIDHQVLNAAQDSHEAELISRAGMPGMVTIATNMAGRGTDIKLGGPDGRFHSRVAGAGGLHIISLNRFESLRIDNQLRGRAGRQGDPGSSQFLLSLEDDLFTEFRIAEYLKIDRSDFIDGEALADPQTGEEIRHAQSVIAAGHHRMRNALYRFTAFMENRRLHCTAIRREALFEGIFPDGLLALFSSSNSNTGSAGGEEAGANLNNARLLAGMLAKELDNFWIDYLAWSGEFQEGTYLQRLGGRDPYLEFIREADEIYHNGLIQVYEAVHGRFTSPAHDSSNELSAAGRTWTYQMDGDEISGFSLAEMDTGSSAAAGFAMLLFFPYLLFRRIFRKKNEVEAEK